MRLLCALIALSAVAQTREDTLAAFKLFQQVGIRTETYPPALGERPKAMRVTWTLEKPDVKTVASRLLVHRDNIPKYRGSPKIYENTLLVAAVDAGAGLRCWDVIPDPRVVRSILAQEPNSAPDYVEHREGALISVLLPDDPRIVELRVFVPKWDGQRRLELIARAEAPGSAPRTGSAQDAVLVHGDGSLNRVTMLILGDGYTKDQLPKFASDVKRVIEGFFSQKPYAEYASYFNVYRLDVESREPGASHPSKPVDNAFGAAFNCKGVLRSLCVDITKVQKEIIDRAPKLHPDIKVVLVNDKDFGGTGGEVVTVSLAADLVEIVLHEVGHNFGHLADEYFDENKPAMAHCSSSEEPSAPNLTRNAARASLKWAHWVAPATALPTVTRRASQPGLFEGADHCGKGVFRPSFNSKMRELNQPFDQISTEQLIKSIHRRVQLIEKSLPEPNVVAIPPGGSRAFSVRTPSPAADTLTVQWLLNRKPVGTGREVSIDGASLDPKIPHTLEVIVRDKTKMVGLDPEKLLQQSRSWRLNLRGQ